jgi:hypothetical protein
VQVRPCSNIQLLPYSLVRGSRWRAAETTEHSCEDSLHRPIVAWIHLYACGSPIGIIVGTGVQSDERW